METLPLSVTVQSRSLNSGILNSTKFITARCHCKRDKGFCRVKQIRGLKISRTFGRSLHDVICSGEEMFKSKILAASQSPVGEVNQSSHMGNKTEEFRNSLSYLFRTEYGGLVKVSVGATETKYVVRIEVSSLPWSSEHELGLSWGMFRSDPSLLIAQGSDGSVTGSEQFTSDGELDFIKMPLSQKALGRHDLELEFDSILSPFFLSFLLHSPFDAVGSGSVIRTHRKTNFCVPVGIGQGHPMPLGVSFCNDGRVNFSLFSRNAEGVVLCLYSDMTKEPSLEIALDPYVNRTGDIWHVAMPSCQNYVGYGYRCKGDILWDRGGRFHMRYVLLDPYAKVIGNFNPDQGDSVSLAKCVGVLQREPFFEWDGDVHPRLPMERLVVYRLNVGLFTEDLSSELPKNLAGTFAGLTEKIHHFKSLGVNAILLEPIFSFDEQKKGPYFPYHFFSPMNKYGPDKDGVSAITSMKNMVKKLHAEGIEVLLEVVFTHTAEGGDAASQMITFRGIDHSSYYIVDGGIGSGPNNALNCNNPIVQNMILDSLRHWVIEFHIDGFCFVNASSLLGGSNDYLLSRSLLMEAITFDPLLSNTKIIADCWSPLDMSYNEVQFPHWKRWAEMNTRFCTDVRNFLRGEGLLSDLATRLCGSGDIFSDSRGPAFSFNFITKNFGLPLVDLVSFSGKKLSSELSWNCGVEGPTNNSAVLELRLRQIRNFLFILFISLGVPVLNMGDECGLSTGGSPSYNDRMPFNWTYLKTGFAAQIMQFISFLSSLRTRRSDLLQVRNFLKVENIEWQGNDQSQLNWKDPSCKFLAMLLKVDDENLPPSDKGSLFVAFNASDLPLSATLPQLPEEFAWSCLVDTALSFPGFFPNNGDLDIHLAAGLEAYELQPHSCALFDAKMNSTKV